MSSLSETTQTTVSPANASLQTAVQLLRNSQYDVAIQHCESTLESDPGNIGLVWELGLAYFLNDDALTAQMTWLAGLGQADEHQEDEWLQELIERLDTEAVWQYQQKNLETVQALCHQILELEPAHQGAIMGLGNVAMLQENYDEAIAHFQHILDQDPTSIPALTNIIHSVLHQEDYGQVAYYSNQLLQLDSSHAIVLYGMGCYAKHQGHVDECINDLRRSITADPTFTSAYLDLVNILLAQEQFQDAIALSKDFLGHNPDNIQAMHALGMSLCLNHQLDEAIECLNNAIKQAPTWPPLKAALSACWIRMNRIDNAIAILDPLIEAHPDFTDAAVNRALAARRQGDFDRAQQILLNALCHHPDNVDCRYELGLTLRDQGDIDGALSEFQRCLELHPKGSPHQACISEIIQGLQHCQRSDYFPTIYQGEGAWDTILLRDEDCYRLFYLKGDRRASPFYSVGEMGAATSKDLQHWDYHGVILKPQPDQHWQSGRILSGSVYKENGTYYFFYSAAPSGDRYLYESIGLATSTDGIYWNQPSHPLLEPDPQHYSFCEIRTWAGEHLQRRAWRDPYLIQDPVTGKYYLFIVATINRDNGRFKGCLGLAVADTPAGPYTLLPPVFYPTLSTLSSRQQNHQEDEGIFAEIERPQIIFHHGQFHLFFSCGVALTNPAWLDQLDPKHARGNVSDLYHFVSSSIEGPFIPVADPPMVKGDPFIQFLYGMSLVQDASRRWFVVGARKLSCILEVSQRLQVNWTSNTFNVIDTGFVTVPWDC